MQTLKNIWATIRKYSGLLIGLLLAGLTAVALGRKPTKPPVIPTDADRNGKNDQEEIDEIREQAKEQRDAAQEHVEAAQEAVQRPVEVRPSKSVRETVQRNNEVDY